MENRTVMFSNYNTRNLQLSNVSLQISCSDSQNLKDTSKITIAVSDVDEPPQDIQAVPAFIRADTSKTAAVSNVTCTDPEGRNCAVLNISKCSQDPCPVAVSSVENERLQSIAIEILESSQRWTSDVIKKDT